MREGGMEVVRGEDGVTEAVAGEMTNQCSIIITGSSSNLDSEVVQGLV